MSFSEKIGERIRLARIKRGFSATELAEKIGMSKQLIANWEKGRRTPTLESVISLADALDSPVTYFLHITDDLNQPENKRFNLDDLSKFNNTVSHEDISIPVQFLNDNNERTVIRITDDSMSDHFRKYDLAIIKKNQAPTDGCFILFQINKTEQILFRKYTIDNSNPAEPLIKLKAINKNYPDIQYDPNSISVIGICDDNLRLIG